MPWTPSPHATHVETVFDPDNAYPGSVLVEHFNDPFEADLPDTSDASVHQAAYDYLVALRKQSSLWRRLRIPPGWVVALDPAQPSGSDPPLFGWVPPESGHGRAGPRGSFRFQPKSGGDHLVVLFASERLEEGRFRGSGFGIALATHIRDDNGQAKASFVGLTATLPHGEFLSRQLTRQGIRMFADLFRARNLFRNQEVNRTMAAAAGLDRFVVRGVRLAASGKKAWIERRGIGTRKVQGVEVPHFVSMLSVGNASSSVHTILHRAPLFADAAGDARVFDNDPSSVHGLPVRPTRNDQASPPAHPIGLDDFRVMKSILPAAAGPLEHHLQGAAQAIVKVMPCPAFVPGDPPVNSGPRRVTIPGTGYLPIRSDDASAVQAFFHTRDLIDRLTAYGWDDPASYFRLTKPEIKIFYRYGITPGPGKDGRTVNARVIPEGWADDQMGGRGRPAQPPAIALYLAWADLRRRDRQAWTSGGARVAAIPFGIGADKRWLWHEFGHALLVASTGELELRFAHSPGDAMAAIVADPESRLPAHLRSMTFPFVFLPRQHNRCCSQGWSWTGTMHADLAAVPDHQHPRRKGYTSEQILSSSLFRLYRIIGGDTETGPPDPTGTPDVEERRRASHYALYLVMQAMQLMGDANLQPTSTPARFVHCLRQADRRPGLWQASYLARMYTRVGGTLAKVIRWAFAAQGLYGVGNGPGAPEPVDIYIEDGRPSRDSSAQGSADHGRGGYVPVSLHWQPEDGSAAAAPLWQARPGAGMTANGPRAEVRVGNRGSVKARKVAVQLWYAPWSLNTAPPDWMTTPGTWLPCQSTGPATRNIQPGATGVFKFTYDPPAERHILFAEATCMDDRAHTDPHLSLPCSRLPTPLVDLAANDNNLGVLVVAG